MTEGERRRERAMAMGVGTDVMTAAPMLVIGVCSGSLTLLADAIRGGLLTLLELFAYVMMRRIHRGRLPSYQYGCGKIESFLNALIGGALVLSSIWVFGRGVLLMLRPPEPSPLGLAAATAIAAVNVAQNAWMFVTFLRARRVGASILIDGQVRTRILKLASSVVATLAILASAIFAGQISGRVADLIGSAVVAQVMLWTAYQLIAGALPDLMDRMLDHSQVTLINRVLFCNFDRFEAIHHLRTRRCGVTKCIEIGLGFPADLHMGEVDAVNRSLKGQLEAQIPDARVTIVALAVPSTPVRRHGDLSGLAALSRPEGVRREPAAACDRPFALRRARFDRRRIDQEARAKGVDLSGKVA
jgi:cation diffusion facilitator family transporter